MIFCVEDDSNIRELVVYTLESTGFQARGFEDGSSFLEALALETPELVLLDIMLPGEDGMELLRKLKASKKTREIPVIMVTAKGAEYDKVKGLDAGADDYIVKPFAFEELTARIRSLGRRSGKWEDDNLLTICDISYDCNARLLSGPTGSIRLSGREGRLLEVLLRSFELVIRREVLLSRVWGVDAEVEDCNLDTYIHYLRKRLSYVGSTLALKTIRGVGYTLASS